MAPGRDTLPRVFQGYVMAPVVVTQRLLPVMLAQGVASPEVQATVIRWLATAAEANRFQRPTIQAQAFAIEQGIVADWRAVAAEEA